MRISLNEIKKYVAVPESVTNQELIDLIGSRLVEVEETIDLAPKYKDIYVVKVVTTEKIPDTHLTLCQIDAGGQRIELTNEDRLIQVVCGAPNVHAGMLAVWLAPGTVVPQTYGNENFKLGTRKLQGYESNGMLAAVDELDLGTDHEGIAEIDPKIAQAGSNFAEVFGLNDIILDVENKSLTHRPDCFGLIGFAREVSGILGLPFTEPELGAGEKTRVTSASIKIDPQLCSRYSCAVFDLPKNEPSKYLTLEAVFLAKAGMRTIDPMVDLTNILMLRTGQPLHAFDYDKFLAVGDTKELKIIVRAAEEGETLQLLDGKTIECIPDDILITSNNVPVALAGAMGGKNTEIDASTTRVVLESATFSLYNLRKTQMAHGIFSEAITRFTKGQPAPMTMPVLKEALRRLEVQPTLLADAYPGGEQKNVVKITTTAINNLLGTQYTSPKIAQTLTNVGFNVQEKPVKHSKGQSWVMASFELKIGSEASGDPTDPSTEVELTITVPKWRTDVHLPEDIIEEVGRLLGYDNIPLELPRGPFTGTEISLMLQLKSELRNILSNRLAMNELLTYSFVSRNLLEKVGQDAAESYEIVNSISPELQCFRQQIAPSLLDKVRENIKAGHKQFTLYEINQVTSRQNGLDADGVPVMVTDLGIVGIGDFYQLKAQLFAVLERGLKIDIEYSQIAPGSEAAKRYPYLEPVRSVELFVGTTRIGAFGEVKAAVKRKFKLEVPIVAAELELDQILAQEKALTVEVRLSKFPAVERDITLKTAVDIPFGRINEAIRTVLHNENLIFEVKPVSIYQPNSDAKNLSFHLKFASPEGTLDSEQIATIMEKITVATAQIGAMVV